MMKYTYRYWIVKGDIDTSKDIGIIKIRRNGKRLFSPTHWVRFPDGSLRSNYNSETIDEIDYDMFAAFEMAPELKVAYRPISGWLVKAYEYAAVFTIFAIGFSGILGIAILIAGYFFNQADVIINGQVGAVLTIALLGSSVVGIIACMICAIGDKRYTYVSNGDKNKKNYDEAEHEKSYGGY